jgi:two-component system sensor histidine kinase YesM
MAFNLRTLKAKILLAFLGVFLLLVGVTVGGGLVVSDGVRRAATEGLVASVRQAAGHLALLLSRSREITYVISTSAALRSLVNEHDAVSASPYRRYQLTDTLAKELMYQAEMNAGLRSIYLYLDGWDLLIASGRGVYTGEEIASTAWMRIALASDAAANRWVAYEDSGFGQVVGTSANHLVGLFMRPDAINRELRGRVLMSVNVDPRALWTALRTLRLTPDSLVFLVDRDGRIAAAADDDLFGRFATDVVPLRLEELLTTGLLRVARTRAAPEAAGPFLAAYQEVGVGPWGILAVVPEAGLLASSRTFWRLTLLGVCLLFLAIGLGAWRIAIVGIDRPVARLVRFMAEVERGGFDRRIGERRDDEFGFLLASANDSRARTPKLISQLYAYVAARRASRKVLQSQINPHFLYNTLDTINWIARANGVEEISRIVRGLSTLYRASFNRGREYIECGEMVRSMEGYLLIERYRYRNLADYRIEVAPEAAPWLVLNLVLQPLVENAVIHGIGGIERPGRVVVAAGIEDGVLRLAVEDDGIGMPAQKLALIREGLAAEGEDGDSGMRNVHRRIRIFYGEPWGLTVESAPDRGTRVEIRLPVACAMRPRDAALQG